MPGVPREGSNQAEAFYIALWSAIYAGVVVNLCTGVIIGVVAGFIIWQVQKRSEQRAVQRSFEREVVSLLGQIRPILSQEDAITPTNAIDSESERARAISALLADKPIDLWRASLPSSYELFDALNNLRQAHARFVAVARQLDLALAQFVRTYHAGKNIADHVDFAFHQYCVMRFQGQKHDDLVPWIKARANLPYDLEQSYPAALHAVPEFVKPYLDARNQVQEKVEQLKRIVG
jgi:hypothetical protein